MTLADWAELVESGQLNEAALLLDPRELMPDQDSLDFLTLADIGENAPPVLAVLHDDLLYLEDGHHRTARAICREEKVLGVVLVWADGEYFVAT